MAWNSPDTVYYKCLFTPSWERRQEKWVVGCMVEGLWTAILSGAYNILLYVAGLFLILVIADLYNGAIMFHRLLRRIDLAYWTVKLRIKFDYEVFSELVERYGTRLVDLRPVLKLVDFPLIGSPKNHTHGSAASERTSMNAEISRIIKLAGKRPYHISMSRADQARGDSGERTFYWEKDFKVEQRKDTIEEDHVIVLTDVDYYVDINSLMNHGLPIVLYTVVPQHAAHRGVDSCYHINNNEVVYEVAGGGKYRHKIWNYDQDTFTATLRNGDAVIFDVEQRIIQGEGTDHRMIMLIPTFIIPYQLAAVMPMGGAG